MTIMTTTPYFTDVQLRDELELAAANAGGPSERALARAERRIRGVVEQYTGQTFSSEAAVKTVYGGGDSKLRLPERLASLNSVTGPYTLVNADSTPNGNLYEIRGDGFFLNVKMDAYGAVDQIYTNPIRNPDISYGLRAWTPDAAYTVDGIWGYTEIPESVQEAVLILIEDYLDPDSEYRERYLNTVRAADWNLVYHDNAYRGTGNATADALLQPYIRWSMTVV